MMKRSIALPLQDSNDGRKKGIKMKAKSSMSNANYTGIRPNAKMIL